MFIVNPTDQFILNKKLLRKKKKSGDDGGKGAFEIILVAEKKQAKLKRILEKERQYFLECDFDGENFIDRGMR